MKEYSNYEIPAELTTRDAQLDPYPFFRRMRRDEPVRYDERRAVWDVFRYEDICEVVSQPAVFSSEGTSHFGKQLIASDPPDHTVFRNIISDFFTASGIERLDPVVQRGADRYLADAVGADGRIDFNEAVANPYSISVFCELVGLPESERERYREWTESLFAAPPAVAPEPVQASHEDRKRTHAEMTAFFEELVSDREDDPRDDLISALLDAEGRVEQFDRQLTVNTCNLLMSAGHITTATFISNAMLVLTRQRAWPAIRSGAVSILAALDEVLRYRSPVLRFDRIAAEETELAGHSIEAGDRVILWPASGNRDERVFDQADRFVPDRDTNRPHIAFGQGIHTCIGNQLARHEAAALLSRFADRYDEIRLDADELDPFYSTVLNGMERLPLRVAA